MQPPMCGWQMQVRPALRSPLYSQVARIGRDLDWIWWSGRDSEMDLVTPAPIGCSTSLHRH